jgi:hypothetical protein
MGPENSGAGDWAGAFQKAQGDFVKQWSEMSQAWARAAAPPLAPTAAPAPFPPFPPFPPGPAGGDEIAHNFLRQCEQSFGISRSLWELMTRSAAATDPEQRAQLFTQGLGSLQQQFAGQFAGLWNGPPQALPALGPTREAQESWQRLGQLGSRYWQAQTQVSSQWNDIIDRSLRELGERLAPRLRGGAQPGSMQEVYDQWIESAESVYAQAARSAGFVQAQAELTNSMSQLRSAQRELMEEWARQFDLPTRSEINSIHQQLRELKAALKRTPG